jgi:hypothetical protein
VRRTDDPTLSEQALRERVAALEERIIRLETRLGIEVATPEESATVPALASPPPALAPVVEPRRPATEDDLEFEVGQNWFALAGVGVLTAGVAFLLSLPYASLPAAVPALAGFALAATLFAMGQWGERRFAQMAAFMRPVAMALLAFAALRLFYFGPSPALDVHGLGGRLVLLLVIAGNLVIALRRRSPGLTGLALTLGLVVAFAGGAGLGLPVLVAFAVITVAASRRFDWPVVVLALLGLSEAAYLLWAAGNPLRAGRIHFVGAPEWAPAVVLLVALIYGSAPLWRRERRGDDPLSNVSAFLNTALGFGAFLLHTAAAFPGTFAVAHLGAALGFLGLAVAFFRREQSRVSTFFYAMTGYAALSFAILKLAGKPEVFVWLSLQSVVVVATAIWFRSRFIVVANFFIYTAIVLAYIVLAERETGISVGFGIVALVSARILNWQKDRLELKTGLMRNAYLVGAFLVFPYACYHLVPVRYVGLAWVGLALGYYAMNFIVQNQKYRWMGHATLLLTTFYLGIVGTSRFEPVYRVLSFLVLGTVLLIVSLVFTRLKKRQSAGAPG